MCSFFARQFRHVQKHQSDHNYKLAQQKKRTLGSKKLGCSAAIYLREVIAFPEYKLGTPVVSSCGLFTTELARVEALQPEFWKREVKPIALSCNDVESLRGWSKDIMTYVMKSHRNLSFPIISDKDRNQAVRLGMIDPDERNLTDLALTRRAVFIIGLDKKLKFSIVYPDTTGLNIDEIFRVLDSLQLTATEKVATPVDWKPGSGCFLLPSVSIEEAKQILSNSKIITTSLPSEKQYMRWVATCD